MRERFFISHAAVEERILGSVLVARPAVLEAGCGRASRLARYRHRIRRLVGVDLDASAGERNSALDEFLHADAGGPLPFPAASFDVICVNFAVERLARPALAFREWRRLLAQGGSLVIAGNASNPTLLAGFAARPVSDVATVHRYAERLRSPGRRSALVAWYQAA